MVILCHISNINNVVKEKLHEYLKEINSTKKFIMVDIDDISKNIISSPNYKSLIKKISNANKNKQSLIKSSYDVWKKTLGKKLLKIINDNKYNYIIIVGLSSYYNNLKVKINIPTSNKFLLSVDEEENAKEIIKNNLLKHMSEIINGTFPLNFLDKEYIIEQHKKIEKYYNTLKYKSKTYDQILEWISTFNQSLLDKSDKVYFASTINYDTYIMTKNNTRLNEIKRIVNNVVGKKNINLYAFPESWMALVALVENKKIEKGFSMKGKQKRPYIKELEKNAFETLNKSCYLYTLDKDSVMRAGYKYKIPKDMSISYISKTFIKNIKTQLTKTGVDVITYK